MLLYYQNTICIYDYITILSCAGSILCLCCLVSGSVFDWIWSGCGLAVAWLWLGCGLALAWFWLCPGLILGLLSGWLGFGLVVVWHRPDSGLIMAACCWIACGFALAWLWLASGSVCCFLFILILGWLWLCCGWLLAWFWLCSGLVVACLWLGPGFGSSSLPFKIIFLWDHNNKFVLSCILTFLHAYMITLPSCHVLDRSCCYAALFLALSLPGSGLVVAWLSLGSGLVVAWLWLYPGLALVWVWLVSALIGAQFSLDYCMSVA